MFIKNWIIFKKHTCKIAKEEMLWFWNMIVINTVVKYMWKRKEFFYVDIMALKGFNWLSFNLPLIIDKDDGR